MKDNLWRFGLKESRMSKNGGKSRLFFFEGFIVTVCNTSVVWMARNKINNFSKDFQRLILKKFGGKENSIEWHNSMKMIRNFCWIIKQSLTIGPLMNVITDHFTEAETKKKGRSWMKLEENSRSNLSTFMSNIAFFSATIVSRDQRF